MKSYNIFVNSMELMGWTHTFRESPEVALPTSTAWHLYTSHSLRAVVRKHCNNTISLSTKTISQCQHENEKKKLKWFYYLYLIDFACRKAMLGEIKLIQP